MTRDTAGSATERPLRRDAARNRQRILASAREVFQERGFGATLDEVAAHAGLGVGTVYRRFPNKEHLIEAMFAERLDEVGELMRRSLDQPDAWRAFIDFLWQAMELVMADRGLLDAMTSTAFGQHEVARVRDSIIPTAREMIARAKRSGELRRDLEPEDLPVLFKMIGGVAEYTHHAVPDLWRRYVGLLIDSLRAQPGQPSPLPLPALDTDTLRDTMDNWCH